MPDLSQPPIVERYKQLVKAMNNLTSILNPELLLENIVETAANLSDAKLAWILLPDQSNKVLKLETGCFIKSQFHQELTVSIETSLEGWVFLNHKPVIINQPELSDNGKMNFIRLPDNEIKSILIVPVITRSKRTCILEVANKQLGDFNSFDQEILETFARHAATCIDKLPHLLQSDLIPELVHELRTPLAALNTALHLLQRHDLPEERREHVSKMIQTEFNRLTDLTTSFLDYSRLESGKEKYKPTRFDLNQLIRDSIDIIQIQLDDKDMKISLEIPNIPLFITADRDKIKQVILNLLNNAVKFSTAGGIINITVSLGSEYVSLSVRDNGQGIPPEYLPRLFERFYRLPTTERQIKGTGLGLTICKHIVEAHNGKIEVRSIVGKGSTFIVQLPVIGGI